MADPKDLLRVFISSTSVDLEVHRQAVFDAILGMGFTAEDMVYWSADERSGYALSAERLRQCDVVILIVAHRYGYIPEGAINSVTEQEYNAARSAGIPVLAFMLDEALPWPPAQIEWDQRDKLLAFKAKVKAEVTVKTFTSPDQLAALVSQALAGFKRRHDDRAFRKIDRNRLVAVHPTLYLAIRPDLTMQIRTAEDDVPMLLQIRRSRDLNPHFNSLAATLKSARGSYPSALLSSFRQSLEQQVMSAWASEGIEEVRMTDDSVQKLFVLRVPLSDLFKSTCEGLFSSALGRKHASAATATRIPVTAFPPFLSRSLSGSHPISDPLPLRALQSEGGANRFLAVSPVGSLYSVGRPRDRFGRDAEGWVEWRPFIYESVPAHFPKATFIVTLGRDLKRVSLGNYNETLAEAVELWGSGDTSQVKVTIEVSRTSLAGLLTRIAASVASLHAGGKIHGDLKPNNVLLSTTGVRLIDEFDLKIGDTAPGWTPDWSAPEQVIGGPVTAASDVYPFGRMISDVLGGRLVGEVRKYKVTSSSGFTKEFDVFYDPTVRCAPDHFVTPETALPAWADLCRRCLKFDPGKRPGTAAELGKEIAYLSERYPLLGHVYLQVEKRPVLAAFLDGSSGVARQISIDMTTPDTPKISDSGAWRPVGLFA